MISEGTTRLFGVDLLHDTTAFGPATTDAHIDVRIAEGVKLVVFHFNVRVLLGIRLDSRFNSQA